MPNLLKESFQIAARIGFNPYNSHAVQAIAYTRAAANGKYARLVRPLTRAERERVAS